MPHDVEYVSSFSGLTEAEKEKADCVICMTVKQLPKPYAAATRDNCAICKEPVWVAITSPKTPPRYCFGCAMEFAEAPRQ